MRTLLVCVVFGSCQVGERVERLAAGGCEHELVWIDPGDGVDRGFWIGRYEVTNAQFAVFVAATGYDGSDHPSSKPTEPFLAHFENGQPPAGEATHPVCNVNLHHARAYCAWLSQSTGRRVRLPRDAEWQLAATGGQQRVYPWGDAWDPTRCNWGAPDDGFVASAPVGSFPSGVSTTNVHDLAGNIWEWTQEGHLRGGPWCMGAESVRVADIADEDDDRADDKFGLRIVVER